MQEDGRGSLSKNQILQELVEIKVTTRIEKKGSRIEEENPVFKVETSSSGRI